MTSASQTPGGYKFAPLVASQQGRANHHEPACFGLSSSWFFPSRSGIPLHTVVQPWVSLQRSISISNVPPLVLPFCAIPPRPGLQSTSLSIRYVCNHCLSTYNNSRRILAQKRYWNVCGVLFEGCCTLTTRASCRGRHVGWGG